MEDSIRQHVGVYHLRFSDLYSPISSDLLFHIFYLPIPANGQLQVVDMAAKVSDKS